MMKLNQFIAKNTPLSRRQADIAIRDRRVTVKNKIITNMALKINENKDKIRLDKKPVLNKDIKTYLILNKPKGYLSSIHKDDAKAPRRRTILKLIPPRKHLKLMDRLDTGTEGLLILSNDGKFINRHHDRNNSLEKEYLATVKGKIAQKEIGKLKKMSKTINVLKTNTRETLLTLTINEVRNKQIQKLFDSIRHPVKYLQRIRVGKIKLGNLKRGKYRLLTKEELDA
ncbi:rRNA pseudouridine synthase [Candidatus Peregrinibacteria bacterium]|nr:rRNA pseudouridine synthase [Candidatus Peregrinibacteria bacterium]